MIAYAVISSISILHGLKTHSNKTGNDLRAPRSSVPLVVYEAPSRSPAVDAVENNASVETEKVADKAVPKVPKGVAAREMMARKAAAKVAAEVAAKAAADAAAEVAAKAAADAAAEVAAKAAAEVAAAEVVTKAATDAAAKAAAEVAAKAAAEVVAADVAAAEVAAKTAADAAAKAAEEVATKTVAEVGSPISNSYTDSLD